MIERKGDLLVMRTPIMKEKMQKIGTHLAEIFPALRFFIFREARETEIGRDAGGKRRRAYWFINSPPSPNWEVGSSFDLYYGCVGFGPSKLGRNNMRLSSN